MEVSTCPCVPDALNESNNDPAKLSLATVVVARVEVPVAAKRLVVALMVKRLVVVALVPKRLVKYRVEALSPPVVEALPCIYREATVVEERVEVARVEIPVTERVPVA